MHWISFQEGYLNEKKQNPDGSEKLWCVVQEVLIKRQYYVKQLIFFEKCKFFNPYFCAIYYVL